MANICKKIREARLRLFGEMVRTCGEKCRGVQRKEAQNRRSDRIKTDNIRYLAVLAVVLTLL